MAGGGGEPRRNVKFKTAATYVENDINIEFSGQFTPKGGLSNGGGYTWTGYI